MQRRCGHPRSTTTSLRAESVGELRLHASARTLGVLGVVDQVRVGIERLLDARMAQLPRDVDDVLALRNQDRRGGVPEVVEAQALALLPRSRAALRSTALGRRPARSAAASKPRLETFRQ